MPEPRSRLHPVNSCTSEGDRPCTLTPTTTWNRVRGGGRSTSRPARLDVAASPSAGRFSPSCGHVTPPRQTLPTADRRRQAHNRKGSPLLRFITTVILLAVCLVLAWTCGSRAIDTAVHTPMPPVFASAALLPIDPADTPPVTTTTTSPPTPSRYTPAGDPTLVALVVATFPEDPDTALRIVACESGWNPTARSATNDSGLFQINDIHRSAHGVAAGLTVDDLYDPATNVRIARTLYDQSGWLPWSCY